MGVIGEAFVDVIAKTDKVAGQVGAAFEDAGSKAGGMFSGAFGKVAAGVLSGAAVAGGIGAGLYAIGNSFDEAFDKLRADTGATGEELERLQDTVKAIGTEVPASFTDAADALTILTQKVSDNADATKPLAEQYLELSRITGTDLKGNVTSASDAFNAWGVTVENQPKMLDELFRAHQQTGIAVSDLASQIGAAQPQLHSLGFTFEESAALAATLSKNGASLGDVMPALGKAMAAGAKDGKPAAQVLRDVMAAIQNAPDDTAAAGAAIEVFGAKAGPKLASMIRQGKLGYDDLLKSMQTGSDTIMAAGADTQDFAEKWEMIKNRVLVGLEPLATRVFSGIGTAMDKLGPKVEQFQAWFEQRVVPVLERVSAWIEAHWPQIATTIENVMARVSAIVEGVLSVIASLWDTYGATILEYVRGAWEGIRQQIEGALTIIQGIIDTVMAIIHGDWSAAWDGIREILRGVWEMINGIIDQAMASIRLLLSAALDTLRALWSTAWDGIRDLLRAAWDGIRGLAQEGIDAIVGFFRDLPGRVRELLGDAAAAARELGQALLNGVMSIVDTIGDKVAAGIGKIPGLLRGLISDITTAAKDVGASILSGIVDGISGAIGFIGDIGSAVGRAAQNAINAVIDKLNATIIFTGFTIPGPGFLPDVHVPGMPDLPHVNIFHSGGVVPGYGESLALLQGGEVVFTKDQARYLAGLMVQQQAPPADFMDNVAVHIHVANFHGTRDGIRTLAVTSAQHTARVLGARRARFDLRGNR